MTYRSALMIRRTRPLSISKLPERGDGDRRYRGAMEEGSKALCQAILETGQLHGPMSEQKQIDAVSWAYDVTILRR